MPFWLFLHGRQGAQKLWRHLRCHHVVRLPACLPACMPAPRQAKWPVTRQLACLPARLHSTLTHCCTLPVAAALPAASWWAPCATIPAHPATQWCSVRRAGAILCARIEGQGGLGGAGGLCSVFSLQLVQWHVRFCPHRFCRNMLAELPKWLRRHRRPLHAGKLPELPRWLHRRGPRLLGKVWQRMHRPGRHMLLPRRHQGQGLLQEMGRLLVTLLRWMVSAKEGGCSWAQHGLTGPCSCLTHARSHLTASLPWNAVQRLGL